MWWRPMVTVGWVTDGVESHETPALGMKMEGGRRDHQDAASLKDKSIPMLLQ